MQALIALAFLQIFNPAGAGFKRQAISEIMRIS